MIWFPSTAQIISQEKITRLHFQNCQHVNSSREETANKWQSKVLFKASELVFSEFPWCGEREKEGEHNQTSYISFQSTAEHKPGRDMTLI